MGDRVVRRHEREAQESAGRAAGRAQAACPHMSEFAPRSKHFLWRQEGRVGVITLNRPERKNPLTFDSYAELRDVFRALREVDALRSIVLTVAGGIFSSVAVVP